MEINKKNLNLISILVMVIYLFSGCNVKDNSNIPTSNPSLIVKPGIEILDQDAFDKINNDQFLSISKIQGKSHISPFVRKSISDLFGIVTFKRADGFYLQSVKVDNFPETSEGIFIYTNLPPKVVPGDWVLVDGQVDEFYPGGLETGNLSITQIEKPIVTVVTRGNDLPSPVIIGENGRIPPDKVIENDGNKIFDMQDGLDFYKSMESMVVQVNHAVCISASTAYKEFAILTDMGKYASGRNNRGGITISKGDFNPERIIIDDSFASVPIVSTGDYFNEPIIGILDYSFGNFKLQPIKKIQVVSHPNNQEVTELRIDGTLAIASLNVENLDPKDAPERFNRLAEIIVYNLRSPEIIALQEIQDNNGPVNNGETDASETYNKVISAIIGVGGPEYSYTDISPINNKDGGEPGGNIRVGFLYKNISNLQLAPGIKGTPEESVNLILTGDDLNLNLNPARIDPRNFAFVDSRKPLVAEFLYNGNKIFIINNHWNSKGGDTPLFGNVQPPRLISENQRKTQSRVVSNFISQIFKINPASFIVLLGDLNDYYFSTPIEAIKNTGMIDLFNELPETERYTYNYDGNSQNLDNLLISPALFEFIGEFDIIHLNSEFPYLERFSDHDPILVSINLTN
jgi:hypothetical protein